MLGGHKMAATETSPLLRLPTELLQLLPASLHDIEDFKNLSSTCRTLRNTLAVTSPHTILHLCAAASRVFFRPDPAFLVSACARQLNVWLSSSEDNIPVFKDACRGGLDGLLKLCLGDAKCGLTMNQIRELYLLRMSTINPIEDLIDRCVGVQWYSTPNFWNGGVSDALTVHAEPISVLFDLSIYGDIFGPAIDIYIREGSVPLYAQFDCRKVFVEYCIPKDVDWWVDLDGQPCEPPVPLKRMEHENNYYRHMGKWEWSQPRLALRHVLNSTRFKWAWNALSQELGEDESLRFSKPELEDPTDDNEYDSIRYRLRKACFMGGGMQSLEHLARTLGEHGREVSMAAQTRLPDLLARISGINGSEEIRGLTNIPQNTPNYTSIWPDLISDLDLLEVW